MTRTTGEVINELDNAITDTDLLCDMAQAALVVGFEHECRMVFRDDPDRLTKLNTMVRSGGMPLGLIKITRDGGDVNFLSRPLIEYRDDLAAATLLSKLCAGLGKRIAVNGLHSSSSGTYQKSHA
jgi:hypothetical protein